MVCYVAYIVDGRPNCTPRALWRECERLYWHGSSASRAILDQNKGLLVCVTVTHVDALAEARSGFHHSISYCCVRAFGTAHAITDRGKTLRLMDDFINRIYPGRSKLVRQPNERELKATTLMGMEMETVSGKTHDKHVADDEEDYAAVPARPSPDPITQVIGEPSECARQLPRLTWPEGMVDLSPARGGMS